MVYLKPPQSTPLKYSQNPSLLSASYSSYLSLWVVGALPLPTGLERGAENWRENNITVCDIIFNISYTSHMFIRYFYNSFSSV